MITASGRTFFKRYLANQGTALAGALAIGVGSTAENLNDQALEFEYARVPIELTSYDFSTDRLVFKATLPSDVQGKVYEIGLWTDEVNPGINGSGASRILTTFDSATETWTNGTYDTTTVRIGDDSLKHTPAASATVESINATQNLDLGDYSNNDKFLIAYNCDNANTQTVAIRFYTDSSNYYSFSTSSPSAGYHVQSFTKGSATITGSPDWSDITQISVLTTAKSGGAASVEYDGIRIEDVDTISPTYGLIARKVLSSPVTIEGGIEMDIEYALAVTIS